MLLQLRSRIFVLSTSTEPHSPPLTVPKWLKKRNPIKDYFRYQQRQQIASILGDNNWNRYHASRLFWSQQPESIFWPAQMSRRRPLEKLLYGNSPNRREIVDCWSCEVLRELVSTVRCLRLRPRSCNKRVGLRPLNVLDVCVSPGTTEHSFLLCDVPAFPVLMEGFSCPSQKSGRSVTGDRTSNSRTHRTGDRWRPSMVDWCSGSGRTRAAHNYSRSWLHNRPIRMENCTCSQCSRRQSNSFAMIRQWTRLRLLSNGRHRAADRRSIKTLFLAAPSSGETKSLDLQLSKSR